MNMENGQESNDGTYVINVDGEKISLTTKILQNVVSDKGNPKLGAGSFADVYGYVCPRSNRSIALKLLKNTRTKKSKPIKIAKDLLREIVVHRDLHHKNILKFYGHIKDPRVGIFLVIQYAEKGSLTDLMFEMELDRSKILIYIQQILQGLSYLHNFTNDRGEKQPIAHRDLRCHNVLMMADGTLKIADFGLCKRLLEMAEASGISSKRGNSFWIGPELIDRKRRKDLEAKTLVLTDIWSLGVLILELYYYSAYNVPYMTGVYSYEEYTFKLGQGWGPKIPNNAPLEIKKLLGLCFEYVIDDRASADQLVQKVMGMDPRRKANLEITEPIRDPKEAFGASDSENTLQSRDTAITTVTPKTGYTINGLEVDPLSIDGMDEYDTQFLTKLHDPKILVDVPPNPILTSYQRNNIMQAITQEELDRYVAKDMEEFILEDNSMHDGKYHVKNKENDKVAFLVHLREKKLSLKRPKSSETIFSVDSSNKRNRCISAHLAGGIFGRVQKPTLSKKMGSLGNLRLEVSAIGEMGAKTLDLMSPRTRRRNQTVTLPVSISENSALDRFQTARESFTSNSDLESLTGSDNELTYKERKLDVKKNSSGLGGFKYTIRYREDKAQIGHFITDMDKGRCEICVTPDSNTALVVTIVAYYYQQKLKKQKRFSWTKKLNRRSGLSESGSQGRTSP